jgi:hypothetical protein
MCLSGHGFPFVPPVTEAGHLAFEAHHEFALESATCSSCHNHGFGQQRCASVRCPLELCSAEYRPRVKPIEDYLTVMQAVGIPWLNRQKHGLQAWMKAAHIPRVGT